MQEIHEQIPRPEHPNPIFRREEWHNLNGTWGFQTDPEDVGCQQEWYRKAPKDLAERIMVPFSWTSPASGIQLEDYKGVAWYGREVIYTPSLENDHVWLCFGGVDYACQVYINGKLLLSHEGGYGPFEVDVTEDWALDKSNFILVRVEDNDRDDQTRGKQGYGEIRGIWQTVWMETRAENYMNSIRFETHMDGKIIAHIQAYAATEATGVLSLDFGDVQAMQPIQLAPGINEIKAAFTVSSPVLWSPDTPHLYEGTVGMSLDLKQDIVHTYFGIREIAYAKFGARERPWITLNGKPVYLNGTLDQSFNPTGHFTLPTEEDVRQEVVRLKDLGLNMVRIHIKPEEPRKLYWLDKLGVMVFSDMCCFWGEPTLKAREAWEAEMREVIRRDFSHPSIIAWIAFNETWGLFTHVAPDHRLYLPETQEWVSRMVDEIRALDPTRLVEDNSACNYDHVNNTDLVSWHFYLNGYRIVRDHVRNVVTRCVEGGPFNFVPGHKMPDVPLMNSECGMVWGIEDSAGDSDIAWQYRYMLNEFRLHEALCGFVFTEFHDVVNEFNGYYRLDNQAKEFGYDWFVEGMGVKDLHAGDFIAIDAPPCQTLGMGENVRVPLVYSGFGKGEGRKLALRYELWHDNLGTRVVSDAGSIEVESGYGTHNLESLLLTMPEEPAVAVLSVWLYDGMDVVSRNFITFDVRGKRKGGVTFAPRDLKAVDFDQEWSALSGHKRCGCGQGCYQAELDISALDTKRGLTVYFEAGAKRLLQKDSADGVPVDSQANFMWGYKMDPGTNVNSYFMTDETHYPARLQVLAEGRIVAEVTLENDFADSRGVLSWHYQSHDRYLEEAGSFGELIAVELPMDAVESAAGRGKLALEFRSVEGGLAVYGRNAGRYPIDILIKEKA